MHVLGHSFSQRRKSTKRPRDLHIRKVSFSGSSLSSGCSTISSSSSTSTFTARTPMPDRVDSAIGFDPVHTHSAFHAPPRLNDRPLIRTERPYESATTFYNDEEDEEEDEDEGHFDGEQFHNEDGVAFDMMRRQSPRDMELPPHSSPSDHTEDRPEQPQDYFLLQLSKRPQLNRSHWSESTINTIDTIEHGLGTPGSGIATPSETVTPVAEPIVLLPPPNFSYKRTTTPKRPPFKAANSVENFIKRGGWKRRGIVFNGEEASTSEDDSEYDGEERV